MQRRDKTVRDKTVQRQYGLTLDVADVVDGHHHHLWIGTVGPIVIGRPTIQFHKHGDDGNEHEQHAKQQHHSVNARGLFTAWFSRGKCRHDRPPG